MSPPKPEVKRCVLCGSTRNVQANHLGGKSHIAWFTMPFCDKCHRRFHEMVKRAGIDLSYMHDPIERNRRAMAAINLAQWMLIEQLKNARYSNRRRIETDETKHQ